MKSILNKTIFGLFISVFINGCHTFEHQNIFLKNMKVNLNQQITEKEEVDKNNIESKIEKNTSSNDIVMAPINAPKKPENSNDIVMAPINAPKKPEKVKKLSLQKNVKISKPEKFSLKILKNWNEERLIKGLGKSDFVKEEGKLKNYQYYFKECYLDVFLIKTKNGYFVDYIETRPTKLNGKINVKACFEEINKVLD